MFKFDFFSEETRTVEKTENNELEKTEKLWLNSKEHILGDNIVYSQLKATEEISINKIELEGKTVVKYLTTNFVVGLLNKAFKENNSILQADQDHSDLVTAVYEGGLKIWQCTYDLLNYLYEVDIEFKDKHVLDLGCGAGVLGLYAYLNGGHVCFQDYNPEVVEYVTMSNVVINTLQEEVRNVQFYSGDWKSFTEKIKESNQKKFDYILTSETIYNCDNYIKLNELFKELLKSDGTIYLAAKTYYFGVGGGLRSFEDMLKADKVFNFKSVWENTEGVQREILLLQFKNN